MRHRINTYFLIVVGNVKDSIPKIVGYFLVKKVQETIKYELNNAVNNSMDLLSLLGEVYSSIL